MIKIVIAAAAAVAVGAGGVAWAHDLSQRAERHDARHDCVESAKQAHPGADRVALADTVAGCMEEAGFTRPEPTPEQQERRATAQACIAEARAQHEAGSDGATAREGARACLEEAGFERPGRVIHRLHDSRARRCLRQARDSHDGRDAIRAAVQECVHRPITD